MVRPDQSILRFASTGSIAGRLLSKADSAGRTLSIGYTGSAPSIITDTVGRTYNIATDSQGRVTQVTDVGLQRTVAYTYTGQLLTDFRDLLGRTTHYSYTSSLLTSVTLPDSTVRVQNHYDSQSRLTWQDAWTTAPFTVTYDVAVTPITETIILSTNPPRSEIVTRPVSRTLVLDDLGRTTAYDNDPAGRLVRIVDANGNATIYHANGNDEQAQTMDALGNISGYNYDALGNLLSMRDPTARGTDYAYDNLNRLVAQQDTLGRTTTYTYTTDGLLRQLTDPLIRTTTYTYTTVPLTTTGSVTLLADGEDALGRVTHFGYNGLGQMTVITDSLSQSSTVQYDSAGRVTRSTDPSGVAECREYDAADHLTAVVRNCIAGQPSNETQNVRTEYGYDLVGRRVWERNPVGEVSRTFYDSDGKVTSQVAGCAISGVPSTTTCDAFTSISPHLNRITSFGYDSLGRQASVTDTLGIATHTDFDTLDRPFRTWRNYVPGGPVDASTNVTSTLGYDQVGRTITTTDTLSRRSVAGYDAAGRVVTETQNYVDGNPLTGTSDSDLVTLTEYNEVGQPVTRTTNYIDGLWNPAHPDEDNRTVTSYDKLNRVITSTESYVDGVASPGEVDTDRITTYNYDEVGNMNYSIDPLGRVNLTTYDLLNRATEEIQNCTDGAGNPRTSNCATGHGTRSDENVRSTTAYTARGEVSTSTDPLGRVTHTFYDPLGRVTKQVMNEGGLTSPSDVPSQYAYDALGHTVIITDALNGLSHNEYNTAGWLTRKIDQTNRAVRYSYDGLGRQTVETDALNRETHTVYDALSRPTKSVTNWQDGVHGSTEAPDVDLITSSAYDAVGRRLTQTAPDNLSTHYEYDGLDRLKLISENAGGVISPSDVKTTYTYDRRSLLNSATDAENHQRQRGYNAAGWLVSQTDPLSRTNTYGYDRVGRRLTVSDPRPMTVTYGYDGLNRTTTVAASGLTTITMQYDLASRRTGLTDETGTTSYTYDGLDRITKADHSIDKTVYSGYDLLGRRTSLSTSTGSPALTYTYDGAGRMTGVLRNSSSHTSASYDLAGRLTKLNRANGVVTKYVYDGADRLTQINSVKGGTTFADLQYSLNVVGQVLTATEALQNSRVVTYGYDGLRRLTSASEQPGTSFQYNYDAVGNRTKVYLNGTLTEQNTYDAADQVVGWTYDAAGNLLSGDTNTYAYDGLNRLTDMTPNLSTTRHYSYNGDGILAVETNNGTTTRYTLDTTGVTANGKVLPERLGATTGGSTTWYVRGFGQELSSEAAGSTNAWYLSDRLGSIRATVDSTPSVLANYNYNPYGVPEGSSVPADYGFTGEPQNTGGGLIYLRARWYNAGTGHFGTHDPLLGWPNQPQSQQYYMYGYDDPANRIDPSGQASRGCSALNLVPLGLTECDKMMQEVQGFIAALPKPGFPDLFLWSRNKFQDDLLALKLGDYYSGLNPEANGAGLFLGYQGVVPLLVANSTGILRTYQNPEKHRFTPFFGQAHLTLSAGELIFDLRGGLHGYQGTTESEALAYVKRTIPSQILQHGFRSNYYSNTHHFFPFFLAAYMGGLHAGQMTSLLYEYYRANFTVKRLPYNPVDREVAERASEIGSWFGASGFEKAPTIPYASYSANQPYPNELVQKLRAEMCLNSTEKAELQGTLLAK